MTTVGAYVDLGAWEKSVPGLYLEKNEYLIGDLEGKSPEGLEVNWGVSRVPPEGSQVYVYWEPTVIAVWEKEGEDEGSNGTEAGITGEDTDAESDESA